MVHAQATEETSEAVAPEPLEEDLAPACAMRGDVCGEVTFAVSRAAVDWRRAVDSHHPWSSTGGMVRPF